MADKSISELVAATAVGSTDLFVLEQTGTAKKLTGQILENWLVSFADGHGGIQTVAKTGTSGLVDTYTITYADTTTSTFTVTNGKAISSVTQYWAVSTSGSTVPSQWSTTRQTMTPTNKYLWSYMTFTYNDGTTSDSTKSVVGVYGDTGAQTYVWIKYSAVNPTSDSDMGDIPDKWIGIYTGLSSTAPTHYTDYAWYQYKGEQGDQGDAATISAQSVTYMESSSGTVVPSGSWAETIPLVAPGNFLWTRTILTFNDGTITTAYSVARWGIDGSGSVSTVNNVSPDSLGNVALTASYIPTTDSTSVQSNLNDLQDNYSDVSVKAKKALSGKRAYIIGDSLNERNGGYGQYVLSISGMVGQSIGNGSSGFVKQGTGNKVFADLLLDLIGSLTAEEKMSTDYLILMGGINDALNDISASSERPAVEAFIATAKTAFPNAELIINPLHTFKWLSPSQYACYGAIIDACQANGVKTTDDFMWWTIVDDYGINTGDNVHLTASGCQILGGLIVNYLLGGEVLRTWAYSATSSIGTVFSNSLTRRGRDFFWRGVVTSLTTATPNDLSRAIIISCSNQAVANAVWSSGAIFISGFVYGNSYLYPIGVGVGKLTSGSSVTGISATCYILSSSQLPQSISGFSVWIEGLWKAGIDDYPSS